MGERKNWIKLGAVCATAVLVAFGAASAESIEGSVRGSSPDASTESNQKDYYWKVWNGALPEQPATDDRNDLLAVLTGKFTGPANRLQVRLSRRRAQSFDDCCALGHDHSRRESRCLHT